MISVIKTAAHHQEILERVSALIDLDPIPESTDGKELEVLTVLLKDYESRAFPLAPPSPLAAIRLRMDQMKLSPKDLISFLGARSRVSEVLAGKRPLSLAMIRALREGLRIPLESLVADSPDDQPVEDIQWDRFPVRELLKVGWITDYSAPKGKRLSFADSKSAMEGFFVRSVALATRWACSIKLTAFAPPRRPIGLRLPPGQATCANAETVPRLEEYSIRVRGALTVFVSCAI